MKFELNKAIQILEKTPQVLKNQLSGLSEDWIFSNEGPDTWSAYDVLGHLIHGENTDWIERINIILNTSPDKQFRPFDRFAQIEESKGKSMMDLLKEFTKLREQNLEVLKSKNIGEIELERTGIHPVFGTVTLRQLLSTWVVHDLNHTSQISRVMAKQYQDEVGPWVQYLRILK